MWIFNEMEDQVEWCLFLKQIHLTNPDLELCINSENLQNLLDKSPSYKNFDVTPVMFIQQSKDVNGLVFIKCLV